MAEENFSLITPQLDPFVKSDVKHIFEEMPWMQGKSIVLLTKKLDVENYINKLIAQGIAAFDLETTGLNTRLDQEGKPYATIVGLCLAASKNDGVYIPIAHKKGEKLDSELNVPIEFMLSEMQRLASSCILIFHNFKYDGAVLRNYGIYIGGESCDEKMYEDTLIMAVVQDASRKDNRLKHLAKTLLQREMLEIKGLGVTVSDDDPAFDEVPPEKAVYYGAADAMNTFYLYEFFKALIDNQDPDKRKGPWGIYKIEKKCMFVTMEMERNHVHIDIEYLKKIKADLEARSAECMHKVWDVAGRQFDIASPKQLGTVLFDELKIPYPVKEKTKNEGYVTSEFVLGKIAGKHPIVTHILDYRGYQKYLSTYIDNLLLNADENNEIKFELNQTRADTGRYSATGGQGFKRDGYCGVNCQNLPRTNKKDPKAVDIRKALIARPGFKIVTLDYSGEELRVAANFSKEEKWINEFLHGTGDLHTITTQIIFNKTEVSKDERNTGKTLNFTVLYGGGPGTFAARANISFDQAKKFIYNFFKQYTGIERWVKTEAKISRKRGYAKTALGRRRPLTDYYNSPEKEVQKKGDRCAVNTAIQGSSADIIKIALHRVSKWIREQGLQDKIRMLIPIHDEIVYEIKNDGSEEETAAFGHYVEEIAKIMIIDDIPTMLGWPVHLAVDAEYGDSFSIDHDYFKEKQEKLPSQTPNNSNQTKEASETKQENVTPEIPAATYVGNSNDVSVVTIQHSSVQNKGYQFEAKIRSQILGEDDLQLAKEILLKRVQEEAKEIDKAILENPNLKNLIDEKNYLTWTISNFDTVVAKQIAIVINLLENFSNMYSGPKCHIKLTDKDGEVLYTSPNKVSADAFVSLCLWLNI